MDKDELLQIFNESISGKNEAKGKRVFENDLVSSVDIENEENIIYIKGNVISESLFSQYNTEIQMDADSTQILSTYCSCSDYENNETKWNYCCKHLIATFYRSVDELSKNDLLNKANKRKLNKLLGIKDTLDILLGNDDSKEELKIEVYINKDKWDNRIYFELKIGLKSMNSNNLYVLKDINTFLLGIYQNIPVPYGKKLTLDMKKQKLSVKDKKLVDFIQMIINIDKPFSYNRKVKKSFIDGKYVYVPDYLVREFFQVIKEHRVYLNEGFELNCDIEIIEDKPPIEISLKDSSKGDYILSVMSGMPISLSSKNNVFLYGLGVYIPDYEYCEKIGPYFEVFNSSEKVSLSGEKEEIILRKLVPNLKSLSNNVSLSEEINNKIVIAKCEFKFYFDNEDGNTILTVKVKYGAFEFNIFENFHEKVIYRDEKREVEVIETLRALRFERIKDKFILGFGDDYAFTFFKTEIGRLQRIGEVFYSENFKGIKHISGKGLSGHIKTGKYNYFEMKFKIEDLPPGETVAILRAFRENLKYFKLKDGEFIDLEELQLKNFLKLIDSVSPKKLKENIIELPKSKSIYVDEYLEENGIRYIKGQDELKKIRDKFKKEKSLVFEKPDNLNGTLREYQRQGYNWLKTLDYFGFGGILGDEMGLGKTFQVIAFLLSNTNKKTLIIVPTSLVYNWIQEFEKFAPSMKVAAAIGARKERELIIKNIDKCEVIITTYNLLKRDLASYVKLKFDYCILDEAQNIKNPHSQNAISVKKINAGNRFALSGTPMENSVMELWSIFDFIMPGYLYDENRFSVRYYKKLKEEPAVIEDLNRLIRPFILRRKKKEVALELPDKIEKIVTVDMESKQKKVYSTYAKYAVSLIEKRVEYDEFKKSKIEILSYITRLRQICLDPSVVMEDYTGNSAKIEALIEVLNHSIDEGHKILVFSQFTSVLKNIAERFKTEGIKYSYLDGAVSSKNRINIVKEFNEGSNSVFLISLKAGGTGLNLTSADVVVHFDPWWNPAVEEQASDRAHRIGQQNVVEVIKLVARGTIEEKIIKLQKEKKKLVDSLLSEELSTSEIFSGLSEEEILHLFK
ncbi:DEAD/DEAH box helicase [Clostridium felsineum]|uniref:DEAD/DEAH box helicase n=1 Tax=Clostridium felsineum TaxID=36839 RepID=UPI00214DA290|nr:DEAD/DEAH box helicase [Clostridium felsineum]MCR3757648.1 DEAD/DEAH box helicase [Clostridium felsineum]